MSHENVYFMFVALAKTKERARAHTHTRRRRHRTVAFKYFIKLYYWELVKIKRKDMETRKRKQTPNDIKVYQICVYAHFAIANAYFANGIN